MLPVTLGNTKIADKPSVTVRDYLALWSERESEWDDAWLYTQAMRAAIPPDFEDDGSGEQYDRFKAVVRKGFEIDDLILAARAKRIRPVVRHSFWLHHIKPVDLRSTAFTWDPKLTKKADERLTTAFSMPTLHGYGYYGMFKPSIAEVLAQLPRALAGNVVAFETNGLDSADDLNGEKIALNAGYHVATTTFYVLGD